MWSVSAWATAAALLVGCRAVLDIPDNPHLADPESQGTRGPAPASAPARNLPALGATSPTTSSEGATVGAFDGTRAEPTDVADRSADSGAAPLLEPDAGLPAAVPDAAVPPDGVEEGTEPSDDGVVLGACLRVTRPSITDFTFAPGANTAGVTFGSEAAFRGTTFFYPAGAEDLASDVSASDWHVSGAVRATAGFGLLLLDCPEIDASAYAGIAFTLSGELTSLVFYVETAAHQVSHVWLNENKANATDPDVPPNVGRCVPESTRYDGTCHEPRVTLPVTEDPIDVQVLWSDLTGGRPDNGVDPSEITSIAWTLPQPTDEAYSFQVHIDDLRFIPATP